MSKKVWLWLMATAMVLGACAPSPSVQAFEVTATATPLPLQPEATATVTQIPTAVPSPTPEIGTNYKGYWLKLSKEVAENGGQTMKLMYQDGSNLFEVASFCVRDGGVRTPVGFYFLAQDRQAVFSTAPGEYAETVFPHNFVIIFAEGNYYIHPAPWNVGDKGCPVTRGGGCLNMRWADFDVLHDGGEYINPLTGEKTTISPVKVGTPLVILEEEAACTYLGDCLNLYGCTDFHSCFVKYTCQYCFKNAEEKWNDMQRDMLDQKNP